VDAYAVQRHYRSQWAVSVTDARVFFKLETSRSGGDPAKTGQSGRGCLLIRVVEGGHPVWVCRESAVGHEGLGQPGLLRLIVDSWSALTPLLEAVRRPPR
jgi:hypothetical protein